ncbi:MAG: Mur ligase family protein, partial [Candidatus Azambacteria bacterium]|nr:Mur ligase family protein [Candidatus Azambacteria bacterium]
MEKSIWKYKKIHMIGVKGVGMTALAQVLTANGFSVNGSDEGDDFMAPVLATINIVATPFDPKNVKGVDMVIRSNAYTPENGEVKEAMDKNIPLFSYPEVVAELFNAHRGIAVAGSHGKTTTTAMLAHILKEAQENVTAIVGSKVLDWGSGAIAGDLKKSDALFVLEADEYKEAFLNYRPNGAIITNIDYDHPDYFAKPEDYRKAFVKFVALIPSTGFLVMSD